MLAFSASALGGERLLDLIVGVELLSEPTLVVTAGDIVAPVDPVNFLAKVSFDEAPSREITRGFLPENSELVQIIENLDPNSIEKSSNGTGGVYFIQDTSHSRKVVFKPQSEENDTTGGRGYLSEAAACAIDGGIAGVPETAVAFVTMGDDKQMLGSVQAFVEDSEDAEDFGPGVFGVEDIHRIGILDIRILNCDRHSGNLMRNKMNGKLVPIDHGSSFPSAFSGQLSDVSFEWLQYPQAKIPFSSEVLEIIENINTFEDLLKLKTIGLDEGSQLSTWMSTVILKTGAKHGKTLFEIGSLLQRSGDRSKQSELERMLHQSLLESTKQGSVDMFFDVFERIAFDTITAM